MRGLLPSWRLVAQGALWINYLVRNTAAALTEIRVLVFCIAVWTGALDISVRQELFVIIAVKLDYLLLINVACGIQFFKDVLYKCNIFN